MSSPPEVQQLSVAILRETLLGIPAILTVLAYEGHTPANQIVWEFAQDYVRMPYIVISAVSGGYKNSTPVEAVDINMAVIGYTTDAERASVLLSAIGELQRADMVLDKFVEGNPDGYPIVQQHGVIRYRTPLYEVFNIQNVPYYKAGGIFRLQYQIG